MIGKLVGYYMIYIWVGFYVDMEMGGVIVVIVTSVGQHGVFEVGG